MLFLINVLAVDEQLSKEPSLAEDNFYGQSSGGLCLHLGHLELWIWGQTHVMDLTCGDIQLIVRKNSSFSSLLLCIIFIPPTSPSDIEEML